MVNAHRRCGVAHASRATLSRPVTTRICSHHERVAHGLGSTVDRVEGQSLADGGQRNWSDRNLKSTEGRGGVGRLTVDPKTISDWTKRSSVPGWIILLELTANRNATVPGSRAGLTMQARAGRSTSVPPSHLSLVLCRS